MNYSEKSNYSDFPPLFRHNQVELTTVGQMLHQIIIVDLLTLRKILCMQ